MFNKYLLGLCGALILACCIFYTLWDKTNAELKIVKDQKITLEQELKRRNENAENLAKRIESLKKALGSNTDWANTIVPVSVSSGLCKPKCSDK